MPILIGAIFLAGFAVPTNAWSQPHNPAALAVSPSASSSVWWVGAESTDSSALPNTGVRGSFQVINFAVTGCLSFWVADDLSNNIWGQVGYFICGGSTPVAFYQIWNLGSNTVLSGGSTSIIAGAHTFSMYLQSGTTWAYALDGSVFGTYDMGSSVSSSSYPVEALSEEQGTSVFTIPTVTFGTAIEVMKSGSWGLVQSATSYGTGWGVQGKAQNPALAADQIIVGGSIGVLSQGTQLWGSSGATTSTTSTTSMPPATTTVTSTATVTSTLHTTQTSTLTSTLTQTSTVTSIATSTAKTTTTSVVSTTTTYTATSTVTSTVTSTAGTNPGSTNTVTVTSTVTKTSPATSTTTVTTGTISTTSYTTTVTSTSTTTAPGGFTTTVTSTVASQPIIVLTTTATVTRATIITVTGPTFTTTVTSLGTTTITSSSIKQQGQSASTSSPSATGAQDSQSQNAGTSNSVPLMPTFPLEILLAGMTLGVGGILIASRWAHARSRRNSIFSD